MQTCSVQDCTIVLLHLADASDALFCRSKLQQLQLDTATTQVRKGNKAFGVQRKMAILNG